MTTEIRVDQMPFALFWDFTQRRNILTDVSGQPIGPIFKDQAVCLTLVRNDGKNLPSYAAYNPKTAQISFTRRRKPEFRPSVQSKTLALQGRGFL